MAANEAILSSWKTPFSTPIRKDENACRDLFQNSEKLLASAVSICRLKGSVECQTGGLITVCEELQSLIRLAFSEIRQVEKDFRTQKSHFEDEVTCLKECVKNLEEEKAGSKPLKDNKEEKMQHKAVTDEGKNGSNESEEVVENERDTNCSVPAEDENLQESDPYIFDVGGTGDNVVSVDDASSHKDQKLSRSPQENKKSNSKKRAMKLTSKKAPSLPDAVSGGDDANCEEISSSVTEIDDEIAASKRKSTSTKEKSNAATDDASCLENEICDLSNSSFANSKKEHQRRSSSKERAAEKGGFNSKLKGVKRGSSSSSNKEMEEIRNEVVVVAEESDSECNVKEDSKGTKDKTKTKKKKRSSQDKMQADDDNQQDEVSERKKGRKKMSVAVEDSDEVFQEGTPGNKKDSLVHKKPEEKLNKRLSRCKKSKTVSGDSVVKTSEVMTDGQFELENTLKKPKLKSKVGGMSGMNDESSKKEPQSFEEKDEPLGDMSFLINVNTQISIFVADASRDECELEPMTARERNDVYKVTQLYKLRARIGTKAENNLTTVRLSKQADTKMPKPGRVDRLLSELSIAASKYSPKNQAKRKRAATADGNEQTVARDDDIDQVVPPKKKLSKLSRTKKV